MPPRRFTHHVKGPWSLRDSSRELLTLLTLKHALVRGQNPFHERDKGSLLKRVELDGLPRWNSFIQGNFTPASIPGFAQEFLRGVYWPDDPMCHLFACDRGTGTLSSGELWNRDFADRQSRDPANLIARSHFGNLRFFHAMPSSPHEPAPDTKRKMLQWARFHVELALGRISPDTQIKNITDTGLSMMKDIFSAQWGWSTRAVLAGSAERGQGLRDDDVRHRATGILLHMVQDSFVGGHVEREGEYGAIRRFHSVSQPSSHSHEERDPAVIHMTLGQYIESTPGAMAAVRAGGRLVSLLDSSATTHEIMELLGKSILRLMSDTRSQGLTDSDSRKPLIATDYKSLRELKRELDITYSPAQFIPDNDGGIAMPAYVTISHPGGGINMANTLSESTIKQEELKRATNANPFYQALTATAHPEVGVFRSELDSIRMLSFVRHNRSGSAIGVISNSMFTRIRNKPPDTHRSYATAKGMAKISAHDAIRNMMLHVFGQAIITTLHGRVVADLAGDIHERDQDSLITGKIAVTEEKDAVDNYTDLVNNLYGQELGEELRLTFDINRDTTWTPELVTSYLNAAQRYFHQHKGWRFQEFSKNDDEVKKFTSLLNEVQERR